MLLWKLANCEVSADHFYVALSSMFSESNSSRHVAGTSAWLPYGLVRSHSWLLTNLVFLCHKGFILEGPYSNDAQLRTKSEEAYSSWGTGHYSLACDLCSSRGENESPFELLFSVALKIENYNLCVGEQTSF
jgi:hypothetical protein